LGFRNKQGIGRKGSIEDACISVVERIFGSKDPMSDGSYNSRERMKSMLAGSDLHSIVSCLRNSKENVRIIGELLADSGFSSSAVWSLWAVAGKGVDISPAEPMLRGCLQSDDPEIRLRAVRALTLNWLNNTKGILPPFKIDDGSIPEAIDAMKDSARYGRREPLSFLVRLLCHDDASIREEALHSLEGVIRYGVPHAKQVIREELGAIRPFSDAQCAMIIPNKTHLLVMLRDPDNEGKRMYS